MTGPASARAGALAASETEQWREGYRRRQTRRSAGIAGLSTVVVGLALWFGVTHSPGWHDVQRSFFDGMTARQTFPHVLKGLWLNIRILLVVEPIILVVALAVAMLRTLSNPVFFPVRVLMTIYVDLFRGFPLIILLYVVGFGLPGLQQAWAPKNVIVLGGASLVLCYSAYVAEVFRAGIQSVHPSQRAAARSLGLSTSQTLRLVVLPQAFRAVLPALLNDFVALQKDVGLVSILGVIDAVQAAQIDSSTTANFTPYVIAGLLFVVLAVPSARLADAVAARANSRQRAGAVV